MMDRGRRVVIPLLFVGLLIGLVVRTRRTEVALHANRVFDKSSSDLPMRIGSSPVEATHVGDMVNHGRIGSFDALRIRGPDVKTVSKVGSGGSLKEEQQHGDQFTQFLNVLPADCSLQCMPTLEAARAACDGKIMTCYECDSYMRPFHEPHLFQNVFRQSAPQTSALRVRSASPDTPLNPLVSSAEHPAAPTSVSGGGRGFICIHVSKATLDEQTDAGPTFQSALSLPGRCDFRTRSTLFLGMSLFTSRCTCVGETESWENPMFVHPKLDKCILSELQPISALADMCYNGTIRHTSDMVKADIHTCEKCHGSYSVNSYGYSVCLA